MVVPLVSEKEWANRLDGTPLWVPEGKPTIVVVPHPDDETLAVGGLIATLRAMDAEVTVVAVTDGEHAYIENEGLAEIRKKEQTRALARLGVAEQKIVRLGLTDSDVAAHEEELVARLGTLIRAETQVFAPWAGDFHPDHEACARAAVLVSRAVGATLISYFFWTWHRGTVATVDGLDLCRFPLSEETLRAKGEALAYHASQLRHEPEPEILPENLLWPARMSYELFAL
ncbi:PIG-L deacetylase family protein [Granulicella sp. L46]|uniref:PIG-L deacetylase family protein n=1 Tax=Granulicella sp. L46 TaxID=1641865 RepID=UPI00131ADF25|nr:PIG-L family deacetylase [Granulicella sp. L46]